MGGIDLIMPIGWPRSILKGSHHVPYLRYKSFKIDIIYIDGYGDVFSFECIFVIFYLTFRFEIKYSSFILHYW